MELDPFEIARAVAIALERLEVVFHLGGSLASSIHGLPRGTLDADLVADLSPGQGRRLCDLLGAAFYADREAIEEAIRDRRSFNVIHLETMFKVDVFVLRRSPFDQESFRRSRWEVLGSEGWRMRVSTPEDTVLHKLLWYREGDEVSSRQWYDAVGVLKVQGDRMDGAYLRRWAARIGVTELLERALRAAGA